MINLSTPNDQLLKELKADIKHVTYWHQKHYGGPKKYEQWQDRQLAIVSNKEAGYELIGELVDYHSLSSGNRWKSFEVTSSYGPGNSYTRHFKFCYFDTYGSVGAFKYMKTSFNTECALVFPSHFFLRYADRMGVKYRDADLVCEFFTRNHVMPAMFSEEKDEKGRRKLVIAAKEGVLYGVARCQIETVSDLDNTQVFEVRTFLTYDQLNNRQNKEVEKLRQIGDNCRDFFDSPVEHKFARMMTDTEYYNNMTDDMMRTLEITPEQNDAVNRMMWVVMQSTGDYTQFLKQLCDAFDNKSNKLMDHLFNVGEAQQMCVDIVKSGREPNHLDMLEIVYALKGDDYDWNYWLWKYLKDLMETDKAPAEVEKYLKEIQQQCIENKFTYQSAHQLFAGLTR